jgi:hypothetical protein
MKLTKFLLPYLTAAALLARGQAALIVRRPPATKPQPSSRPSSNGQTPGSTKPEGPLVGYHKSCGLDIPTKAAWDAGLGKKYAPLIDKTYQDYLAANGYQSYTAYVRDKFAPDTIPNSLYCDGIGSCTVWYPKTLSSYASLIVK